MVDIPPNKLQFIKLAHYIYTYEGRLCPVGNSALPTKSLIHDIKWRKGENPHLLETVTRECLTFFLVKTEMMIKYFPD